MKITGKELRHYIEKGRIENIYLFQGPEIGEKNEIIEILEKKIFPDGDIVKFSYFCSDSFSIAEFENTLLTNLLFSDKKIVYLKNIEEISSNLISFLESYLIPEKISAEVFEKKISACLTKPADKKELSACYKKENSFYIKNGKLKAAQKKSILEIFNTAGYKNYDESCYLIMLNETSEKIPQALLDLILPGQDIMFWEMFESQKFEWVKAFFKKRSIFIEDEAVYYILDTIENNKFQLSSEINKIIDLFESKKEKSKRFIGLELIEEYLYHSKAETPFSLYSALLNKNLSKALDILETLFLSDEMLLLNGILWSHRRFVKAVDLYENHKMQLIEVYSNLRIFSQRDKKDFEAGIKNYSYSHITDMYFYLSELDYYLKILPSNLKLVKLQEFVVKFINADAEKSFLQGHLQYLLT